LDCDGECSTTEVAEFEEEIIEIDDEFPRCPPIAIKSDWKRVVATKFGLKANSLYDCFFDLDGDPLLERRIYPSKISRDRKLAIVFQ